MKNNITKITFASLIFLSVVGIASAQVPLVSVIPAQVTKTVGEPLSATVELSALDNNVCVISGDLSFSNLACQSITLGSGLVAQTASSCQASHFVVGIPGCTLTTKTVLNISAAGINPGSASITLSNIKTISQTGEVASTLANGSYTIQGVLSSTTVEATSNKEPVTSTQQQETDNKQPTSIQKPVSTESAPIPKNQEITKSAENAPAGVSQSPGGNSFLASIKDKVLTRDSAWVMGIIALLVLAYFTIQRLYKP